MGVRLRSSGPPQLPLSTQGLKIKDGEAIEMREPFLPLCQLSSVTAQTGIRISSKRRMLLLTERQPACTYGLSLPIRAPHSKQSFRHKSIPDPLSLAVGPGRALWMSGTPFQALRQESMNVSFTVLSWERQEKANELLKPSIQSML